MSIDVSPAYATRVSERAVLDAVRAAFAELAAGHAVQPAQVVTELPSGGDVIAYQAVLSRAGVYAMKVSPYLPQAEGKAVVTAWTLLLSLATGEPLLLVDAGSLTAERTAATSALAVDLLARPDARALAVIGTGPLGRAHLRYARLVRDFAEVRVSSLDAPEGLAAELTADAGVPVTVTGSVQEAIAGADVVMLCTSAATPVVDLSELDPGTVVTSISTNAPGAHEVDPAQLSGLDVYCDYAATTLTAAADLRRAIEEHGLAPEAVCDLPALVAGTADRPRGDRPVFFRSVGLGIEDAAVALAALAGQEATR